VFEGGGIYLEASNLTLTNSIIWNNIQESISLSNENEDPIIIYSDIEGVWAGEGNIDVDPLFFNPENGDYTLQEGSPCIDAGTADLDGDGVDDITIFAGFAPDMGAFEVGCSFIDQCGVCEGDGVDVDNDGICDDVDDCIGMLIDDCGMCNGDNSTCTGCMDESAFNYNQDATLEGECTLIHAPCAC
jgi:hypothetical protein